MEIDSSYYSNFHSIYISFLAEVGIMGFFLILIIHFSPVLFAKKYIPVSHHFIVPVLISAIFTMPCFNFFDWTPGSPKGAERIEGAGREQEEYEHTEDAHPKLPFGGEGNAPRHAESIDAVGQVEGRTEYPKDVDRLGDQSGFRITKASNQMSIMVIRTLGKAKHSALCQGRNELGVPEMPKHEEKHSHTADALKPVKGMGKVLILRLDMCLNAQTQTKDRMVE